MRSVRTPLAAAAAVLAAALFARGASAAPIPPTASATIAETTTGSTTFHYDLNLSDDAASPTPVGTFWFAWKPGQDYMTSSPTNVTSPAGWTDIITGGGTTNGYAIQWKATSSASDMPAGSSLSGFGFDSADAPSVEFGESAFYPTTPVLTSVAYSGAPFSDAGTTFTVSAVPEPTLLVAALPAAMLLRRRARAS
jgi:hypothetical protein